MIDKDPDAYRTISEVAEALDIPPHVLRFWETKFPQIKPLKRGGGRRFYRRADVDLLRTIRRLLYEDGYTIRGVQRLFRSKGTSGAAATGPDAPQEPGDLGDSAPAETEMVADLAEPAPPRVVLQRLADEIAACRAILSDALRAAPIGDRPGD